MSERTRITRKPDRGTDDRTVLHRLLDDARVIPAKLAEDGFVWAQPTITDAVRAIV